jgi:hypothetical protein
LADQICKFWNCMLTPLVWFPGFSGAWKNKAPVLGHPGLGALWRSRKIVADPPVFAGSASQVVVSHGKAEIAVTAGSGLADSRQLASRPRMPERHRAIQCWQKGGHGGGGMRSANYEAANDNPFLQHYNRGYACDDQR